MSKKRILVISQYFYPESFRINDMCTEWVKRGYDVTVLTGIPNYPQGKFYDGYSWTKKRKEKWNGVKIIRIPLIARGHHSIGLVLNYFSFVISGWVWKMITRVKADYVFTFEVSPMTQALIGVWYAKKHHIPHYIYVQDLWPENVETVLGIHSPIVVKPINKMVDYIYNHSKIILATSPSFVKNIESRPGSPRKGKVVYLPQYAEEFYQPVPNAKSDRIPDDGAFKIIFTGNIGYAQGLEILPKAAKLLSKENVRFVIVGEGRYLDEFRNDIRKNSVEDRFILIERQPAESIPEMLCACDAAFLSFMDTSLFEMTIPAKLQSYMACGMPIIAAASGETKRIVEESGCGICSKIGNSEMLAQAVRKMMNADINAMSENSLKYFKSHFAKKQLMDKMDLFFK
ncbi:glycosyltransferase family 4 protein [Ruminococcus sp.]|uniref:glycosyltransferase family 4 protein n=1 Tax=Ruminococcus sp. TaxID=41978 RepID=UPI0025DAACAF|nr:glycosyltransferase family 4 protein [Ruminococcus sp.]